MILAGALQGGGHFTLLRSAGGILRGEFHSARGVFTLRSHGPGRVFVAQQGVSALPGCVLDGVSELVQDCYGSYSTAPSDGNAAVRADCIHRERCGSWSDGPDFIRSAFRSDRNWRATTAGFRVARTL